MSLLAVIRPQEGSRELLLLVDALFILYILVSFIRVLSYATEQVRARRLIDGPRSPLRFAPPGKAGWLFALAVLVLLFAQSPLYMLLVVVGVTGFLVESRRTTREQFGFDRLPLGKMVKWSLLICGAVIFVEMPLSQVVDWVMRAIHLPHPEQESVEFFRHADRPGEIFAFLLQAIFLSPLIEELFFRGFLFTFLKNYTSTLFALVLSAGVFAFAHANLGSVLQLWVLGLVLGLAYEHSGSLLLPIGIHACWNFLTAMSLLLEKGGT
jgi:membrane protease YdiL (CAAX protease family)